MRTNENTCIIGKNVILVPYREKHVLKYHEWMKSQELQRFTASEPLTLEEEYKMQKSWLEDTDKCTFIVLDKAVFEITKDEIDAMIGDTNLFLNDLEHSEVAEAEIMIADAKNRGRRMGWEAIILMLRYGIDVLDIKKYQVKISIDNEKSIRMFSKLGFYEAERSTIFQEITFVKEVDEKWIKWLIDETPDAVRDNDYK